jgi:phosphoglycolate phosphatase
MSHACGANQETQPGTVLFDLDGTVSDSAPGILSSLRYAFEVNGLPPLDPMTERELLGPPFYDSLPPIIGEDMLWPVIDSYRARYAEAMYESTAFPGIADLLHALYRDGRRLAVATSKPEHYAVPIVEHLGLAGYFETVGGDELDGSLRTKALVIGKVLARLGQSDASDVIMIGDRSHDVVGAREHGIEAIGVRWGYAMPGELEQARPAHMCTTPADVAAVLGVDVDARAS